MSDTLRKRFISNMFRVIWAAIEDKKILLNFLESNEKSGKFHKISRILLLKFTCETT